MRVLVEVSVIIPCYRCSDTICMAVESIAAQTMLPKEVILVDDYSNDHRRTLDVLEALRFSYPEISIKILRLLENKGPGSARNEGWKHSTQPYIAFLDADDSWHPQKLEIQYCWMVANPQAALSAHPSINLSKKSNSDLSRELIAKQIKTSALLTSNFLPCRTVMIKNSIKERFLEGKRQAEDYLLWLSVGFKGGQIWFLNQPLAYSYKGDFGQQGLNADLEASHKGVLHTYKIIYEHGFISRLTYYCLIIISLVKHCRRKVLTLIAYSSS